LGKAALPGTLSITASRQENEVGVDLTGKAASPRDAHRVRLLWALPPLILASAIAVSVLAYPHLPEEMPTHWGVRGEPTNLMPRGFAASVVPAMMVWIGFLTGLLMWSASQTREGRDLPAWPSPVVTSATLGLTLVLHVAMLRAALGWGISIPMIASLGVGLLFLGLGWPGSPTGRMRPPRETAPRRPGRTRVERVPGSRTGPWSNRT
jgi:hypothetical protein